ncbi:hypothetical protein GCM10027299_55420 [Larkinella ripae]
MEPLSRRQHGLLLIIVPVLATIASHVVFYRHFPWQDDYQFPTAYFLTVATVMLTCWTVNVVIFRYLDRRLPFSDHPARRIRWQILLGGAATILTFSVVFPGAIRFYSGAWPNAVQLTSGVFVCLTIASLINGGYVGLYLLQAFRIEKLRATDTPNNHLAEGQTKGGAVSDAAVLIDAGNRQFRFRPDEIAYFFSTQGVVLLVKTDGQQLTTEYTSFAKLEPKVPDGYFFPLNRQFMVSPQAVRSVQDDRNRKLLVLLSPPLHKNRPDETVTVSRYRNAEFRKWLRQLSPR